MNTFKYDCSINEHNALLDAYMNHHNTPYNNSNNLHIELYDDVNGAMFMIEVENEIIAAYGVLKFEMEPGVFAGKLSRLHIREDHRNEHLSAIVDQHLDPRLYEWMYQNNIPNVFKTVNVGNEDVGFFAWQRHNRKRKYAIDYLDSHGKTLVKNQWRVLPYVILEKNTWQYCTWASSNGTEWNRDWRETQEIDAEVISRLDDTLTNDGNGWII